MIGAFVIVDYIVISAGNDRYQDYYDEVEFQVFDTMSTQAKGCQGECVLILKITINKVIYSWVRSVIRSQNFDVYFDINMITNKI